MTRSFFKRRLTLFCIIIFCFGKVYSQEDGRLDRIAKRKMNLWENPLPQWEHIGSPRLDSIKISDEEKKVTLYFGPSVLYYPFREESSNQFTGSIRKILGRRFRKYTVVPIISGYQIGELVPNIFRHQLPVDKSRIRQSDPEKNVLVTRVNSTHPSFGLNNNSIALWHSHGYYYEMKLDRWEWQRARLFGTVEDMFVMSYVHPYLVPMLENAGAEVFLPRERDTQINEVIVDNDRSSDSSELIINPSNIIEKVNSGFKLTDTVFPKINPFREGTSLRLSNDSAIYLPYIPSSGNYAVYISYPAGAVNSKSVRYVVSHTGGKTEFIVNQKIGGETWIYLGTFNFNKGKNRNSGSVLVKNSDEDNSIIALDAVRFGGGMGNVARKPSEAVIKSLANGNGKDHNIQDNFGWKISGKPRYQEGSRYYLQYSGMPDSLTYSPTIVKDDYNDDYMSRGMWVNYLMGKGSLRDSTGLGIPIDLSLGFHTDAGVTPNDSVIGTLAIYSTGSDNGKFIDGTSRLASRDLSDIIQTQLVDDIRIRFDSDWTRRGLWDKPYAEARRPEVPAVLLELMSHQNLADLKFGLDPRFRFEVSRSIYKGILKYQAFSENRKYVVQPVPVTDFSIIPVRGKIVKLSWKPGIDNLEPTSKPDRYRIYKRTGENGFDNGFITESNSAEIELDSFNIIYSFKVTAINDGGESFDSEILSSAVIENDTDPVLVVNGFDRISGPSWFDKNGMAGLSWWNDRGVADRYDLSRVGDQYDFDRKSKWLDDDSPGWGASYGDMEGKIIPGNTFDFSYIHGKAILAAGHSFYSVSDEVFNSPLNSIPYFRIVDFIFGEEKSTPHFNDSLKTDFTVYTPEFVEKIIKLTELGTNIFISGAYIGTDLLSKNDTTLLKFAGKYLHFAPRTGHAVKNGPVYSTDFAKQVLTGTWNFNTSYSPDIYSVEAPDAIEPAGKGAICALRYRETNASAGVLYNGPVKTFVMGFPFETILNEGDRNNFMKQILEIFKK
jgi:hypothetical protein